MVLKDSCFVFNNVCMGVFDNVCKEPMCFWCDYHRVVVVWLIVLKIKDIILV